MFGAIQSGVMALWDSFMSNEYVIQAIDLIKQGLTDAWNAIVGFGQAIMSALGGGAGEFDILGFMIQNLQMILNAVGPYIILAIQGIIQVFRNLYTIGTIVWPYITQAISTAIGIIVGVVNTGKAIFTGLMNIWNQCSSSVQSMAATISGALNAAGSAWNSFKSTVMNAVKPILDAAKQVGDAVGQIGDAIGSVGQGGIETVGGGTSGGYSGAGGYGAGGQTVTQGNTIIFNMYGDVRDEKTLDDMMNAINDRLAFDSLANNGVNPNEGAV
jgi:phage-related protein